MGLSYLGSGKYPLLAGVVTEPENRRSINKAFQYGADLLELRLDCFRNIEEEYLVNTVKAISKKGLPIIATVRSVKEGGRNYIPDKERLGIFTAVMPFVDAIDIELSSTGILASTIKLAKKLKKKTILSYHNFERTPGIKRLNRLMQKAKAADGEIVKVATMARSRNDLKQLALFTIENKDVITIAMGETGRSSRVFFPLLGSLVTYGPLDGATAPGQMSIKELKKELTYYCL